MTTEQIEQMREANKMLTMLLDRPEPDAEPWELGVLSAVDQIVEALWEKDITGYEWMEIPTHEDTRELGTFPQKKEAV